MNNVRSYRKISKEYWPVADEAPTEPAPEVVDEPAADEPRGMSLADARALLASFAA